MTSFSKKKRDKRATEHVPYARSICPNCGDLGPHFVPPSFGDKGFFVCKRIEEIEHDRPQP